jgi:plasmid stabilization system protein ParE
VKLIWTSLAQADRKQIRQHIAQDNPAAAIALDEMISEKASRLVDHPNVGRLVVSPARVSWSSIQATSLIYDSASDQVRVLRVLHAARQWAPTRK